jgi:hypothetical protein
MSTRKRRGPVLRNRPSHANESTTTTALDGLSLYLSKHWIRYQEDQYGDFKEPPDSAHVFLRPLSTRGCVGCGCSGWCAAEAA